MPDHVYNCLFLCTHNSARSVLSEGLLNHLGQGRFRAFSAGSHASGKVNPFALRTLEDWHISIEGLRSKNWDEFALPDAPKMDFIITVCDNAAGEVCPVWPGKPMTAHWGVEDPSTFDGNDEAKLKEFKRVALILKRRVELLTNMPVAKLDHLSIQEQLKSIGKARQ
jgi:arsenate reductase (thioredoxin)